jgi:adenylate cyclase
MTTSVQIRSFILSAFLLLASHVLFAQSGPALYAEAMRVKKEGRTQKSMRAFETALAAAKKEHDVALQMKCHLELAELQNNVIYYKEALKNYQQFTRLYRQTLIKRTNQLSDSVVTLQSAVDSGQVEIKQKQNAIDSLSAEQLKAQLKVQKAEIEQQEVEMKLVKESNKLIRLLFLLGLGFLVLLFFVILYLRKRKTTSVLRDKNQEIAAEKDKSDALLLNILPNSVAEELKNFGKTSSFRYDEATVMFTDFKGFTTFASENDPEDVVAMLDYYFRGFDEIISHFRIEKIKTIGDAYLCVSGAPMANPDHAKDMVQAALIFQEFVRKSAHKRFGKGSELLEMRIGIHSGPLVAGVVGSKKFAYDVWGDTVNVAARMEQASESGQINVSENVVQACGDNFHFYYRGELEAKNKGKLKMYFVEK